MCIRDRRISRRDLADVSASDTLHTVQMNEGRFATAAAVGRDLKRAEIRHAMAGMNRQTLVLHPAYIAGFFVKWRNVHYRSLLLQNESGYPLPEFAGISSWTVSFPEGVYQ